MAKNNQKIILILIIVLLIFTSFIALFISMNIKDDNNGNQNNNISSNKPILNKEISRLANAEEYFAVQKTLNDVFGLISNPTELLNYFDIDFINENNLNESNILNYLQISEDDSLNIITEEIYYNDNSNITYYFTKCYSMEYEVGDDKVEYSPSKYYLLIVDMNNHYMLKPLENINNLEEYANNYDLKEVKIDNDSKFKQIEITEENKLASYVNNFTNIMYLDSNKAYNMLDDTTKAKYLNLNSFINDADNINSKLFTYFLAMSTKENEDNIMYKVQNRNGDTITITEYYPNDYKIGFNFIEGE